MFIVVVGDLYTHFARIQVRLPTLKTDTPDNSYGNVRRTSTVGTLSTRTRIPDLRGYSILPRFHAITAY